MAYAKHWKARGQEQLSPTSKKAVFSPLLLPNTRNQVPCADAARKLNKGSRHL